MYKVNLGPTKYDEILQEAFSLLDGRMDNGKKY
jgi:hypothetical protein